MKKLRFILLVSIILLTFTLPLSAEEAPSFDMEQIIITSSHLDQEQNEGTIVSTKVVKPGKATNVGDLLSDLVGVDINRRAAVGDTKDTIKLRGFDSSRFLVVIDDRPVNAAGVVGGYYVDWSTFPLDNVEKVEVIRGPKSAVYGNTLGGVIKITTKKGTKEPVTRLQTMFGSNNLQNYSLEHSGSAGNLSYVLTAGKNKTDGYLRNNFFDGQDYSLKTTYTFANQGELTLGFQSDKAKRGYIVKNQDSSKGPISDGETIAPGSGAAIFTPNDGAYSDKTKNYYDMTYKQPTKDGFWQVQYFKNKEDRKEYNYNSNGELSLDRKVASDRSWGWSAKNEKKMDKHKLTYGVEEKYFAYGDMWYNYVKVGAPDNILVVNNTNMGAPLVGPKYSTIGGTVANPNSAQKLKTQSFYLQDEYQVNDKLSYLFGLRYDKYQGDPDSGSTNNLISISGNGLSPKFEVNYQFNPQTAGYFSLSKAYRVPTMPEYYWWFSGSGSGHQLGKALKAEEGTAYEIGIKKKLGEKTNYRVALYYNDVANYIYNNISYTTGTNRQVYNIDNVKIYGLELDGQHKISDNLTAFANYTYEKTEKPYSDPVLGAAASLNELDYHPKHKANIGIRYQTKDKTQIALSARCVSSQKAVYMQSGVPSIQTLGGYTVANLSVSHPFGEDRELDVYVDNLFGKDYSEVYGYPMQGTTYGISYKQKF